MKKTIISIIIPVYNSLLYLPKCIQSIVVAQNCLDEIEVILVDDGSNDGTEQFLDILASKYEFIKVLHEQNSGGPATPRNIGLKEAKGDYVFFCDNDDYFAPHALDKMLEHALEWKPDVMAVKLGYDGSRENIGRSMFKKSDENVDIYNTTISRTLGPWKLYNRKFLLDNNFEFPTDGPDDNPFVLRAYLLAKKVSVAADQEYYFWTKKYDDSNLSNQKNKSEWYDYKKIYNCAMRILNVYKTYADYEKGKKYMLPRILKWPVEAFEYILLNGDSSEENKIYNLRELLLLVCDKEYLKKSASFKEYVLLSVLIDFNDFTKARDILLKFRDRMWIEEENSEKNGCIYSINNDFKFDASYFLDSKIEIQNIKYVNNNMMIKGNAILKNFNPAVIYNSKIILKSFNGEEKIEFPMNAIRKSDEYTFIAEINFGKFIDNLQKLNLYNKCIRWDICISIRGGG